MIRERGEEDLDPLCAILRTLEQPWSLPSGDDPREWLEEHCAERSWVFDMAPVPVTPTKNVVGHVQIYSPAHDLSVPQLVEHTMRPVGDLLAIGKLFVRPKTHEYGIGRYLLKASIDYVKDQEKLPVLDLCANRFPAVGLYEKLGFEEIPSGGHGVAPMIHTGFAAESAGRKRR